MRWQRLAVVPVVALAAAAVTSARAQGTTTLDARVADRSGAPVEGAIVKIAMIEGGSTTRTVTTKKDGKGRIPFLEAGIWRVTAEKPGLVLAAVRLSIVAPNKQVEFTAGGDLQPGQEPDGVQVGGGRTIRAEIVLGPGAAPAPVKQGDQLGDASRLTGEKKYAESNALVDKLLEADPADAKALYLRGLNLEGLGNAAGARAALAKAVALDPSIPGVNATLGQLAYQSGDKTKALSYFQAEQALSPGEASLAVNVALLLDETGKKQESVAAYEHALELDPGRSDLYRNLSEVYSELGQPEKAEAALAKAGGGAGGGDPAHWFNIGADFANADQPEKAEAAYRKALSIDPAFPEANRELGYLLVRKGGAKEAIACFEAYLKARPQAKDAAEIKSLLASLH